MNPEFLLAHFNSLSNSVDAIPQLRRFVLDLAIRGKLVEQDPKDEPVPELLARIRARREALLSSKAIKPIRADYGPIAVGDDFVLPPGWERLTINETCDLQTGATPDRTRSDYFGGDIHWLVSGDINKGEIRECEGRITKLGLEKSNCKLLPPDSVLMALNGQGKTRATVALLRVPAACNQSLVAIIPLLRDCLVPEYLFWNLRSRYQALRRLTGQDDRRGLNMKLISCFQISIPPVVEQRRIVAKVDELMELCDRLSGAHEEREVRRDRLTVASLHHIKVSNNAETFREHARFYLNHLPDLATSRKQLAALRQNILSLAVQGKLVQQNSEDDSSELLLSKVREIREKTTSRSKNSNINDSDPKFIQHLPKTLPHGWSACPLEELFRFIDYRGRTPTRTARGVRLITAKNVRMGHVANDPVEFIDDRAYAKWMTRGFPQNGDLLFVTEGATMGYVGTIELNFVFALAQRTINLQPYLRDYGRFSFFTLMSPIFQEAVLTNSTGTAVKGIKAAKLKRIRIPIPPLTEQHRIVAKVDELMALCDQLEAQLTAAQIGTRRLLEAVLYQALNDTLQGA